MELKNKKKFLSPVSIEKDALICAMDNAVEKTRKLAQKFTGDSFPSHYAKDFKYAPLAEFNWESGMLCGMYLLAYEYTGEEIFKNALYGNLKVLIEHAETGEWLKTHDVGFIYSLSCVAAYKCFGDEKLRDAGIKAADILLSNYSFENNFIIRGAVRDPQQYEMYRTLVDSMMNIPLFFWASEVTGDQKYKDAAVAHYRTTMKYLIREDGSSFHHYQFDPITLKPVKGLTFQGYKDSSCWSRGHSWLVYGFPIAFSYTGNEETLETFRKVSSFYLNSLPQDNIPYWDFDFCDGSAQPRDSSAGAISACGFLEACRYIKDGEEKDIIKNAALMQIDAIIKECIAPSDAHCIISRVSHAIPYDMGYEEGALYGDYFYMEAIMRLLNPDWKRYW